MSVGDISERIISDAEADAGRTTDAARESARKLVREAERRASAAMEETRRATEAKVKAISEGRAASARLDGAKVMLAARRRVIDETYARALEKLLSMDENDSVALASSLLSRYAEPGDEIVFTDGYPYRKAVSGLSVVREKGLRISPDSAGEGYRGGFVLRGAAADKDLSYGALLEEDRAANETEVARTLFV